MWMFANALLSNGMDVARAENACLENMCRMKLFA